MSRSVRIAAGALAVAVIVVALAQLFGPAIAARVVRSKVSKYGSVESVSVKAWPALELLWRHADEVRVDANTLTFSPQQSVSLLREASGTDTVRLRAHAVVVGGLRLTDVRFDKDGVAMRAEGTTSEAAVARVLPGGVTVGLLGSEHGRVTVRVDGGLFSLGVSVEAVAEAENGKLVVRPVGLLDGLKVTIFEDPHVHVEGVEARALAGGGQSGQERRYALVMWARLT